MSISFVPSPASFLPSFVATTVKKNGIDSRGFAGGSYGSSVGNSAAGSSNSDLASVVTSDIDREQQISNDLFRKSLEWSAAEAEKNRQFQREMRDTAYQAAVKDLEKAGINPLLAARSLSTSVPSGNMAALPSYHVAQYGTYGNARKANEIQQDSVNKTYKVGMINAVGNMIKNVSGAFESVTSGIKNLFTVKKKKFW